MKRKLLMLALAAMAVVGGALGAAEPALDIETRGVCPPDRYHEEIIKVLTQEGRQVLSWETLASGAPILPFETDAPHGGNSHVAYYVRGVVQTYGTQGRQIMTLFADNKGTVSDRSESLDYQIETVGGLRYVVFYHDGCRVYSRPNEQFVIGN